MAPPPEKPHMGLFLIQHQTRFCPVPFVPALGMLSIGIPVYCESAPVGMQHPCLRVAFILELNLCLQVDLC